MSKKIDRALYGPSWFEVIFGAFLSVVIGVVLAAAYLVAKPVSTVKELPKEPVPGQIYVIEGSKDSTKGRTWVAKRQQFVAGMSVQVTEEEINTAIATLNSPAAKKPAAKTEAATPEAEAKAGHFDAGAPNFRIRDNEVQISVPVTVNTLDLGLSVLVHARGGFEKQGDRFVFAPKSLFVGSCAVEKIPGVAGAVMRQFLGAQAIPEDIAGAWAKLANVSVDGARLSLEAP